MIVSRRPQCIVTAVLLFVTTLHVPAADTPADIRAATYLERSWLSHTASAKSVVVALKGKIVLSEAFGFADLDNMVPATASTVYNIGSVSKTLTVVAIMQLLEEGKIGLDDPIQKYVPNFPDKGSPITIFHLLTHTSGIRHYRDSDFPRPFGNNDDNMQPYHSLEESIKIFKDDPLLFRPGAYYSYSSYGVNLLQGVVEKASGMAFEDYMRQHVWGPAGMLSTSFDVPERLVPHRARSYLIENGQTLNFPYTDVTYKFAGGGMISSAEDLARFGVALNHGLLLKPETAAQMYKSSLSPAILQYRENNAPRNLWFEQGLIWRVQKDHAGRRVIYHSGSVKGFGACLVNFPEQDLIVAETASSYNLGECEESRDVAQFFLDSMK